MPTGNGPQQTSPLFASDEHIAIVARGDFWMLCPSWQQVAYGQDGSFANGAPWVLQSASVNFQSQGVAAQQVVSITSPPAQFPGLSTGQLFAVDSVSGASCTLRRIGQTINFGQPPVPSSGMTGVTFEIRTLQPQIDNATYRIKRRFAIDEQVFFRSSDWTYRGAEDDFRTFREAVVYGALTDAYEQETRDQSNAGDFARKAKRAKERYEEALSLIEIRWGPYGDSTEPTTLTGCKMVR